MIIFLIILIGLCFSSFIIYANVLYWRDLKRMTPDEYRMFKDEEREDLQTW